MNQLKTRFFRHYKNKPYRYLGTARHSETLEELALYETLYPNELGKIWVRPKEMFFEDVTVQGIKQPRFRQVEFNFKSFESPADLPWQQIAMIHNACFPNEFDEKKFLSRIQGRAKPLFLIAYDNEKPVGMKLGYALTEDRFYSWHGGVLPEYQGLGVASEMMRIQHDWCKQKKFSVIETRGRNLFKKMIALNLAHEFNIVGTLNNGHDVKIILEKILA